MGRLIKLYETNTSEKELRRIAESLNDGAIIIFPTDTSYALGCSLNSIKAISKIKEIKGKNDDNLSIMFSDISQLSKYARVDNTQFHIIKNNTPGEVTFILKATTNVPNKFLERKSTIGIRIPNNVITRRIIETLDFPLVSTSLDFKNVNSEDSGVPELIWEEYSTKVDIMIDAGEAPICHTTIVDICDGEITVIKEGIKEIK